MFPIMEGCVPFRLIIAATFISIILSACGGGGGEGSESNKGTLTISPASLTFTAATGSGTTLGPQMVTATISGVDADTLYLSIQVSGNAVSSVGDITVTGPRTGTANVYPVSQYQLGPGTYSSTITVIACTTSVACTSGRIGTPQTIEVTYEVTGVVASETALNFDVNDTSDSTPSGIEFSVAGYPAQSWAATSDVPWLSLTPDAGRTESPAEMTVALVPEEVELLTSGRYAARVKITPASGDPVEISVLLNVSRSQVNYVAPYVAASNVPGDVIIRGENLSRYTTTGVRFGTVDATAFTVVSDTEIRATHPALAAGNYAIHLINAEGIDRSRALLQVVDTPVYVAATLPYPAVAGVPIPTCLAYDAERQSLLAGVFFNSDSNSGRLLRYSMATGWAVAADASLPKMGPCTLTADGQRVLVGMAQPDFELSVVELDPVTLDRRLTTLDTEHWTAEPRSMVVANNGRAIFTAGTNGAIPVRSYFPLRPGIKDFRPDGLYTLDAYNGVVGASGDGSVVLVSEGFASYGPVMRYDSEADQLVVTNLIASAGSIVMNRTGSRVVLTSTVSGETAPVYDANLDKVGELPGTTLAVALAPTALYAYTYDTDGSIRKFDVSTSLTDGTFQEVLPAVALASGPGTANVLKMLITPDGQALLLSGSDQIVLVPLP